MTEEKDYIELRVSFAEAVKMTIGEIYDKGKEVGFNDKLRIHRYEDYLNGDIVFKQYKDEKNGRVT